MKMVKWFEENEMRVNSRPSPHDQYRANKWVSRSRKLNGSGVRKICNFQSIRRRISETVQDRTKVTINY